jgi:flagellar protein FliO/FliZ
MWWEYTKAVLLIALIIAAAYFATKYIAKNGVAKRGGADIKIISSRPLSRDKQLLVAEISDFIYILGVSTHGISLIDKIPKSEFHSSLPEEPNPSGRTMSDFAKEFAERFKGTYHDGK